MDFNTTNSQSVLTIEKLNEAISLIKNTAIEQINLKIIESPYLTITVLRKMCRSKKRRIIKKWKKNIKNYVETPSPHYYVTPFGIICHPAIARKLSLSSKKALEEKP